MADPIGTLGGVAVVPETTWGTTPGTPSWDWLHGVRSTLGLRRKIIQPKWLTMAAPSNRPYEVSWVDGELTVMFTNEDDIIGTLLAAGSVKSTLNYVFGGGAAYENDIGLSVISNYGNDHEWIHTGLRPTGYRFSIVPDDGISLTVPMTGKALTKSSSGIVTVAPANESYIAMPTDSMTITYGATPTAFKMKKADIAVELPKSGSERRSIGEATIRKPVAIAREVINLSVTMDLSEETGGDSLDMLADYVAGTELGACVIGDFSVAGWKPTGDFPSLDSGLLEATLSGPCTALTVALEDTIV